MNRRAQVLIRDLPEPTKSAGITRHFYDDEPPQTRLEIQVRSEGEAGPREVTVSALGGRVVARGADQFSTVNAVQDTIRQLAEDGRLEGYVGSSKPVLQQPSEADWSQADG